MDPQEFGRSKRLEDIHEQMDEIWSIFWMSDDDFMLHTNLQVHVGNVEIMVTKKFIVQRRRVMINVIVQILM